MTDAFVVDAMNGTVLTIELFATAIEFDFVDEIALGSTVALCVVPVILCF